MVRLARIQPAAYQKTSSTYFWSGLFTLLLGIPFAILGIIALSDGPGGEWGYFFLAMGVLFAGWGVSQFISSKKMNQK